MRNTVGDNLSGYFQTGIHPYTYLLTDHVSVRVLTGPIVRISPNEFHISDPGFIDELYPGPGKPRDKYDHATGQFG